MAYPDLVSEVSKSRKFKWLVKVGASKGVTTMIFFLNPGGGEVPGNQKKPGYATDTGELQSTLGRIT